MTALLLTDASGVGAMPLTRRSFLGGSSMATDIQVLGTPFASPTDDDHAGGVVVGNVNEGAHGTRSPSPVRPLLGYDERWLQELLFAHPELVLLEQMEPGAGALLPLCRELAIPRLGGSVFLDVLGVTRTGRLVLVECKLWRNPQARREVVAQVLEYGALLRGWSFGDLTARLKQRHGYAGENPIFAKAQQTWPNLDEATFVDGIARSLQLGDFHLVIAGDGIRSDLQAVAAHLGAQGGGLARMALLEVQLWADAAGRTLVVPNVPLRTEIITQRVLVAPGGVPLQLEDQPAAGISSPAADEVERLIDPATADRRHGNRAFWQSFIDEARFDHPDQPPPRHGGENWAKLDLPKPFGSITAYRTGDPARELGVFLRLRGSEGRRFFDDIASSLPALTEESGLALTASVAKDEPFSGSVGVYRFGDVPADDAEQRRWLIDAANHFTSTIRIRLAMESETDA